MGLGFTFGLHLYRCIVREFLAQELFGQQILPLAADGKMRL